jgi:hypothetical protein
VSEDLKRLLDMAGDHAHTVLVLKHEPELVPVFHMLDEEGNGVVAPVIWRDEAEKSAILARLRMLMKQEGIVAYSMVSEAWAAVQPKDWKPGMPDGPMPSERPDRKEVVIAIAADKTRAISRSWDIVRGEAGSIVKLELSPLAPDRQQGRMAELLR